MNNSTILVTGATGDTGRDTTRILAKQGHAVRALVRSNDERAEALQALGAETVVGDLLDLKSLREALQGITVAYFVYPIQPGLLEAAALFTQAAREAGVKAIVNMSQISSRPDSNSDAALHHWVSEQVFDWSGIPTTHLRPTFFAEWLTYPTFSSLVNIKRDGLIRLPFSDVRHAPIAAEDQARLIAAILLDPAPHAGKIYPLYGPQEMNYDEIAATVSEVIGKPVQYQSIEIDEFRQVLRENHAPEHLTQHLCAVAQDYRDGLFSGTNDVIERITGKAPMSVSEYVEAHRQLFV